MEPAKDFNLTVGLRIRGIREGLHLSREAFSEKCDISASFLSAIEGGKKAITSKTLYKICSSTGVSADYIIIGKSDTVEADLAQKMLNSLEPQSRQYGFQILRSYIEAINSMKATEM